MSIIILSIKNFTLVNKSSSRYLLLHTEKDENNQQKTVDKMVLE